MRAVVQRVASASVSVDGNVISSISKGLMVLVGIGTDDTLADVETLANKMQGRTHSLVLVLRTDHYHRLNIRIFDANGSMWKSSVKDIAGQVLCVSQFTLMANTTKGNKPDFHRAMSSNASRELYATFLEKMRRLYVPDRIQDGQFGAMMDVSLTNEGPVTLTLDTRKFEYVSASGGTEKKSNGNGNKEAKNQMADAADSRSAASVNPSPSDSEVDVS
ncbi:D-Tyr tRNAtyr deacylase-like domain-containing protein [Suillus bovinus]|uniref:D-Tyr tRNAtyr deacylase-like domain-containing protein n=1 Tax=Suillus bovinus TaxID=48563 RepID=UPI001B871EAB|nr:D-Tyr tRNAtyr deacylase-like domain-containing protein [Suillus bovinus]KAG2150731.1 D-Tyr tRNAtyr deacylase-like domain-containing protein [Suillus bovinus]